MLVSGICIVAAAIVLLWKGRGVWWIDTSNGPNKGKRRFSRLNGAWVVVAVATLLEPGAFMLSLLAALDVYQSNLYHRVGMALMPRSLAGTVRARRIARLVSTFLVLSVLVVACMGTGVYALYGIPVFPLALAFTAHGAWRLHSVLSTPRNDPEMRKTSKVTYGAHIALSICYTAVLATMYVSF
jgi:hypothetical protein